VRKKPRDARGPKLNNEIIQPHATITAGVRQPMLARGTEGNEIAMAEPV